MSLIEDLSSPNIRIRRKAIEQLARRGQPEDIRSLINALCREQGDVNKLNATIQALSRLGMTVVPALGELLTDPDDDTRIYAVQALGATGDAHAAEHLIAALQDDNPNVRYHAIESLGSLGNRVAVRPLLDNLQPEDYFLTFATIEALGRLGDPAAIPTLQTLLQNKTYSAPAAEALGQIGTRQVIAPLCHWLESPSGEALPAARALARAAGRYPAGSTEARLFALLTAQRLGKKGRARLASAHNEIDGEGALALAHVLGWLDASTARDGLLALLDDPAARATAAQALSKMRPAPVDGLIEKLQAKDIETRISAAEVLGSIGDARAVPALIRQLEHPEDQLVAVAATALGKIGAADAYQPLCRHLGHPNPVTRLSVLGAINSLGHPEHTQCMIAVLREGTPAARISAIHSLGYFGDPTAFPAIASALTDADTNIRQAAVEALPYFDNSAARQALENALHDPSTQIRCAAARALGNCPPAFASPLLQSALQDDYPWVRLHACRSLGQLGNPEVIPAIAPLLNDPAPHVRLTAIQTLGVLDTHAGVALLLQARDDEIPETRTTVLRALGCTRHPAALQPLLEALTHDSTEIRLAAARGLEELGNAQAVEHLVAALQREAEPELTRALTRALGQITTPESIAALTGLLEAPDVQAEAQKQLIRIGEAAIPTLRAALNDIRRPTGTRLRAAAALHAMQTPTASQALLQALDDPDEDVRLLAVEALGISGSLAGRRKLHQLAKSDPSPVVRSLAHQLLIELE